jgi:hypothetical protein
MLLVGQLPQKSSSGRDHIVVLRAYFPPCIYLCAIAHTRYGLTH